MRNRYYSPNRFIPMKGGDFSFAWNLMEGEYLPKAPDAAPESLLDMDMQPVTEDIVGPALVQVRYVTDIKDGERGAARVIVHAKGTCDCDTCAAETKQHGRVLLCAENELKRYLSDLAFREAERRGREAIGRKSKDGEIIAFQFLMCIGASMLPWDPVFAASKESPPTIEEFFGRYSGPNGELTMGSAECDAAVVEQTPDSIRAMIANVRAFMDGVASGEIVSTEAMDPGTLVGVINGGAIGHVGLSRDEALVQMKADAKEALGPAKDGPKIDPPLY